MLRAIQQARRQLHREVALRGRQRGIDAVDNDLLMDVSVFQRHSRNPHMIVIQVPVDHDHGQILGQKKMTNRYVMHVGNHMI